MYYTPQKLDKVKPLKWKITSPQIDTLYIYTKPKHVTKVLTHKKAIWRHEKLIAEGWKQTATIDPQLWIKELLKLNETMQIEHIKNLTP